MKTLNLNATAKQLDQLRKGVNELALHAWWDSGGGPWTTNEVNALLTLANILTAFGKPPTKAAMKRLRLALAFAEQYDKTHR